MQARIREKREAAKGTLLVTLDLLREEVDFTPGQYFFVTLPDVGYRDEKGLRRHITVVTSPNEKGVLGFATRMRESAFKRSLGELPVGAEVEVEPPKGSFALPDDPSRPLVLVAGGIGITVFRSMLVYIREEGLPYRVTLIFSNRDRESTAFLVELQELERELPGFRLVLTMTQDPGWAGETRKIDSRFFRDYLGEGVNENTFLVAGPPAMVEGVEEALEEAGVEGENVLAERYTGTDGAAQESNLPSVGLPRLIGFEDREEDAQLQGFSARCASGCASKRLARHKAHLASVPLRVASDEGVSSWALAVGRCI